MQPRSANSFQKAEYSTQKGSLCSTDFLKSGTWNVSAVNNNPFEYWISNPCKVYDDLMRDVHECIENPQSDIEINYIFSDEMFQELMDEMNLQGISGISEVQKIWVSSLRKRRAISGFLKDKSLGTKRLTSMPDRITNAINLKDGSVCTRPSVISAYDKGRLYSIPCWWKQWKDFMFHTKLQVFSEPFTEPQFVCNLIPPILRAKYPAINEEEQAISIPLQILCLAILDAIFVHIMNSVACGTWEQVRRTLCGALIQGKAARICEIIAESYPDCEVLFIQEAAAVFIHDVRSHPVLRDRYFVLAPRLLDGRRDQNSFILASRSRFDEDSAADATQRVLDDLDGAWVAPGDLLVVSLAEAGAGGAGGGRRLWLLRRGLYGAGSEPQWYVHGLFA